MEYRRLGSAGLKVSTLSFGSWVTFGTQLDESGAYECMKVAFDNGVNFFDNAEAYAGGKSEELMGQAIQKAGWRRSDLVISTKIYWGGQGPNDRGLSHKHIIEGVDAALERLQMRYVDLVFCHRPDPETPIEETVRAMSQVVNQGKAFYWGTSEWSAQQLMEAYAVARREHLVPPQMEQPQYNMLHRERVEKEYARLYDTIGLGTTIWSPLASGVLTGKYNDGIPDGSRLALENYSWLKDSVLSDDGKKRLESVRKLQPVADELQCSMAQLAIAWCARNPRVSTVILGASKPEQVLENLKALDVVPRLDEPMMERIDGLLENKPDSGDPNYK